MSDDMSSMCSSYSNITLGNGEEVSFDKAIDDSMIDLQTGINEIHVIARNLLTMDERDEDYDVIKPAFDNLDTLVKEACICLKDLTKICKQVIPKKPKSSTQQLLA